MNFSCKQCGTCCRWHGFVYVTEADITALAAALQLPEEAFIDQYTRLAPNRKQLCLTDQADGACIFLQHNSCSVYTARPQQCRDYPHKWTVPGGCPGWTS